MKNLALSFLLVAASSQAGEAETKNLINFLGQLKNMKGQFAQENLDASGQVRQAQTGTFLVNDSGAFVWNIVSPYEQSVVSDGAMLQIYDPDLQQVTRKKLDQKNQTVPLLLFSNDAKKILAAYEVTIPESGHYQLKPKLKDALFDSMELFVNDGKPSSLIMTDSMKQKTRVKFEQLEINGNIQASQWKLVIPPDTEIIDER